ncbi:valine--tRNA ligase [bacterium]
MELSPQYKPELIEEKWYKFWIKNKYNHAELDANKKPFTIVIPPPNITGALHMGHALNNVLQDVFIRAYKKMGYNTCWIPGTDHGGIATQNVIEKQLLEKNINRHEIGREKFLEILWKWRHETGDTILMQLEKLGCLCDWERTRFTMDDQCANAVFEAFKKLYENGLIYRGTYMVNWCPRCQTALSDIEVEYIEKNGHLWHIKYPFKNNPEKSITVATTRPETMLGDTAVAVNPKDERYKDVIGKTLILPIMNREIKIIADEMVEMEFGTGAVKITPSHDPNDYETALRHNLAFISVIDKTGQMTEEAGIYQGQDKYECRKNVVKNLEQNGYLLKVENYTNKISSCYRCDTTIEPLISEQWYLSTKEMAQKAIQASKDKKIDFLPSNWEKPYLNWIQNLRDWCISRQIWWGHRIPIWYCENCHQEATKKGMIVSKEKPTKCPDCKSTQGFRQDEDVLDTWFSSSLWPFSILGWPTENKDLEYFYPTSVLATGHEILYLWVARMIMMGLTFMGDIPFKKVYIHGIVRDEKGKKMSKSLGNVTDPLEIIKKYSTDCLRFSLTINGIMGRDLQISDETFLMSRNFCNKLWNASRLILTNLIDYKKENDFIPREDLKNIDLELADKWILSISQKNKKEILKYYEKSDFAMIARTMYEFTWSKYCDWYLEIAKVRLYGNNKEQKEAVFSILIFLLKEILSLLNPIIPFLTEEINENINKISGKDNKSLVITEFSDINKNLIDETAEKDMQTIIDIISGIRNIKGEMRIPPSKSIQVYIKANKSEELKNLHLDYISKLTKAENIAQGVDLEKPNQSATSVVNNFQIYIPLKDLIDINKEKDRLNKELNSALTEIEKTNKKLENKNFLERAPKSEVEKVMQRKKESQEKLEKIKQNIADLSII